MLEEEDVSVWTEASDYFGAGGCINGLAQGSDGYFAVIADADRGWLAPDVRPPGTFGGGTQDGAFFGDGLFSCCGRGGSEFAVDFIFIGMWKQFVQQCVGRFQIHDSVSGEEGWETALEVLVAAFDFAFGLGCGRVAQGDAIEVQSGAELGESLWGACEEKRVVIDVERQRQAMGAE